MWSDIFTGYAVFILEILTILLAIGVIATIIINARQQKQGQMGELEITDLGEEFSQNEKKLRHFLLSKPELKQQEKNQKKIDKAEQKALKEKLKKGEQLEKTKPNLYVIDFKGDISASETISLREEISAIIKVASPQDEVLLRLESPGGVVHGYGLAASQLSRLKQQGIKLTVAVDKVAASGGYMMACVADKIVAAPFAILGSIGVVAQVPNIHRLLKKHDVDVDVMTAGEFKRTVTLLGENSEKGKRKFQQELEQTHLLFKDFVIQNRPVVNINQIATGEHWFGQQALEHKLIDEISTSDDVILTAIQSKNVLALKYKVKKSLIQKMGKQAEQSLFNALQRISFKSGKDFY